MNITGETWEIFCGNFKLKMAEQEKILKSFISYSFLNLNATLFLLAAVVLMKFKFLYFSRVCPLLCE